MFLGMYCLPTFIDSITREFACKTHKERNLHDLKQIGMVSRMALMALCAQGHEEDWVSESLLAHVICVHSCFRFRSLITWRTYHCFFPSTKISVKTLSTCHATSTSGRIRRDHNMTCRNNMTCRIYRYKEKTTVIDCIDAVNSGVQG